MSAVLLRQVREHFSCHAADYDRFAKVQKIVAARLVDEALPLADSGRVLDVGTGTGEVGRCLLEQNPDLSLVICDIAPGMTRHAAAVLPGALAVDCDAQLLPFASGAFSLALSASVYQWMNDLPQAFGEAQRILAAGGLFAFALFGAQTLHELRYSHRQAVAEVNALGRSHVQEFPGREGVGEALAATDFRILRLWSEREVEWHATVADLLRALKKIGAQNASDHRPPGLASRRVMQRMSEIYGERFACDGRIPATYEVIYGLARAPLKL
ncbi:malonyl-CoA O-methyltransferase [Geoalkalibacter ferrihydriticus]|uniref:Malonyl-[acyl-carrier protein] O-methyltransferase n=2 Tax=Geoalkalibacter ferrihydriticus TaxID=392333 RepID=A0A0C2EEG5_9BACT|nr:methyltransferase domain-containing protein [Geoalkalibacter ferrihydriticus]KIH77018.1 hypothetical protein GFER_08150 [Geoalkalibacter ferrihydriticus DSM 17813]SDL38798.1 malonyl-CoA O-methyltransferase [Geoalkalibacter ferrihydriticus]